MEQIKIEITKLVDIATSEIENKWEKYKNQKNNLIGLIDEEIKKSYHKGMIDVAKEFSKND